MEFLQLAYASGVNDGINKVANLSRKQIAALAAAGAGGMGILQAIGGSTDVGKESSKAYARAAAQRVKGAVNTRDKNPVEYVINPMSAGPISETINRLSRRHYASKAESPVATSLIPFYGAIRGGREGEKIMQKKAFIQPVGVIPGALQTLEGGKRTARTTAEGHGEIIGQAAKARKKNTLQYLFNPAVPGPMSEISHRILRRVKASQSEAPIVSQVVPVVGLLRGGKAGLKQMHEGNAVIGKDVDKSLRGITI